MLEARQSKALDGTSFWDRAQVLDLPREGVEGRGRLLGTGEGQAEEFEDLLLDRGRAGDQVEGVLGRVEKLVVGPGDQPGVEMGPLVTRQHLERVRGYVFCREVAGEAELLNIAVDPAIRRSGLGGELLRLAIAWAEARGAGEMFLEVRASNAGAIALYERHGFRAVGRRRDYYEHPVEDAVLYRRGAERPA